MENTGSKDPIEVPDPTAPAWRNFAEIRTIFGGVGDPDRVIDPEPVDQTPRDPFEPELDG